PRSVALLHEQRDEDDPQQDGQQDDRAAPGPSTVLGDDGAQPRVDPHDELSDDLVQPIKHRAAPWALLGRGRSPRGRSSKKPPRIASAETPSPQRPRRGSVAPGRRAPQVPRRKTSRTTSWAAPGRGHRGGRGGTARSGGPSATCRAAPRAPGAPPGRT